MLIPLDYRDEKVLAEHETIWRTVRPGWVWPPRHPYTAEYSWACERLLKYLTCSLAGARVMDAGGGGGSMQHWIASQGCETWNVDVNPRHLHPSLIPSRLHTADLLSTGLPSASFDGILSASAIEHNPWDKVVAVVRHLLGLLRRGCPLVATFPTFEREHYYAEGTWPGQPTWPLCYCFDQASFRRLFAAVADLALVAEPEIDDDDEVYRAAWRAQHEDMDRNSPKDSVRPYMSGGFVLIRR